MKKASKNDVEIDAKIIKRRHWAAKGRPNVDFDDFLGGFERMSKKYEFWDRAKIVELVPKGGLWTAGDHWQKLGWITGGARQHHLF